MKTFKMQQRLFFVIFLATSMPVAFGFKILVSPFAIAFNSRLLNMQKMADMLVEDGHEVSVLLNTKVMEHVVTKRAEVIEYYMPENVEDVFHIGQEAPEQSSIFDLPGQVEQLKKMEAAFCRQLFLDTKAVKKLNEAKYDLIIADVAFLCNQVLVSHLNVTTMWYHNVLIPLFRDVAFPAFPSFVCLGPGFTCETEHMTFTEKVANFLMYVLNNEYLQPVFENLMTRSMADLDVKLHVSLADTLRDKVILVNADFVLDPPVPRMPHVFYISGLYHKKPQPLSGDFEKIVKASEPHGVILLSFGTLVPHFPKEKAEIFARVFGRLKQTVIWRYSGDTPDNLQPNTHMVEWFPQNDLLANPAVKMFITHCGISSTFESTFHGVPVIAMPLFAEQTMNAAKLSKKVKTGVTLDYYTLTDDMLEQGIYEVLENPVYKENAIKTSYLMSDKMVDPKTELRHLVNFTITSGGAPHLFHPYALKMNFFQFYGLDVIFFMVSIIILVIALFVFFFKLAVKFVRYLCCGKMNKEKRP